MIGSCSSISLQVIRRGGRLMIEWAYERVYTVNKFHGFANHQIKILNQIIHYRMK